MSTIHRILTKQAAPKWVKEYREGRISEKDWKRLQPTLPKKVRQIKHLGTGGEQVADLVYHPTHGVSVRKVPLVEQTYRPHVRAVRAAAGKQLSMYEDLKRTSGGKGDITHILERSGRGGLVSYYPYAKPSKRELGPRLHDAYMKSHSRWDRASNQAPRYVGKERKQVTVDKRQRAVWEAKAGRKLTADEYHQKAWEAIDSKQQRHMKIRKMVFKDRTGTLSPDTQKILKKLKKKYPHLHDIRAANIVGGKVVDLSPEVRSIIHYPYLPLAGGSTQNPEALSRKMFLRKPKAKPAPPAPSPVHTAKPRSVGKAGLLLAGIGAAGLGAAYLAHRRKTNP